MKIYLLRVTDEHTFFYAEVVEADESRELRDQAQTGGTRGWLSRQYAALQTMLRDSEDGVGLRMRRIWEWLHRRTALDESAIRALRAAHSIEIYHPTSITPAEALAAWERYLAARRRHFLLWFLINLLIAPLTLLIAFFPGPNVIGYWFCYRAACHALALLGIRRAKQLEAHAEATAALDSPLSEASEEQLVHLARDLELSELPLRVERISREVVGERGERVAVS